LINFGLYKSVHFFGTSAEPPENYGNFLRNYFENEGFACFAEGRSIKSPYQPSAVSGALSGPRPAKKSEIMPIDNNKSFYASISLSFKTHYNDL